MRHLGADVLVVDCEGCFDDLLPQLDAATFLKRTRTIVLENDAWANPSQMEPTQATLRALGYHPTVCVSNPLAPADGPSFPLHACFWSVLQKLPPDAPRTTTMVRRNTGESLKAFSARAELLVAGKVYQLPRAAPAD